jgi:hypothetical protein
MKWTGQDEALGGDHKPGAMREFAKASYESWIDLVEFASLRNLTRFGLNNNAMKDISTYYSNEGESRDRNPLIVKIRIPDNIGSSQAQGVPFPPNAMRSSSHGASTSTATAPFTNNSAPQERRSVQSRQGMNFESNSFGLGPWFPKSNHGQIGKHKQAGTMREGQSSARNARDFSNENILHSQYPLPFRLRTSDAPTQGEFGAHIPKQASGLGVYAPRELENLIPMDPESLRDIGLIDLEIKTEVLEPDITSVMGTTAPDSTVTVDERLHEEVVNERLDEEVVNERLGEEMVDERSGEEMVDERLDEEAVDANQMSPQKSPPPVSEEIRNEGMVSRENLEPEVPEMMHEVSVCPLREQVDGCSNDVDDLGLDHESSPLDTPITTKDAPAADLATSISDSPFDQASRPEDVTVTREKSITVPHDECGSVGNDSDERDTSGEAEEPAVEPHSTSLDKSKELDSGTKSYSGKRKRKRQEDQPLQEGAPPTTRQSSRNQTAIKKAKERAYKKRKIVLDMLSKEPKDQESCRKLEQFYDAILRMYPSELQSQDSES